LRRTPRIYPRDRDHHPDDPCGATEQRSGRLPSCRNWPGCPGRRTALASMVRKRRATRTPFSPRSRRYVRQYVVRSAPWPASRRRLALRLTGRRNARCVGPTSAISLLRTSTRASLVLPASNACAPAKWRTSTVVRQCDSLRRAATDAPPPVRERLISPRRALSSRRHACMPCL